MLTRGQMKRMIDRLPEGELRFLSQVMEGMLAVYKLQRDAGAAAPVGTDTARARALRPLNDILEEIEQGQKKDPMREVMITPVKDLIDQINIQGETQGEPAEPPVSAEQAPDFIESTGPDDEQARLEARRKEQRDWTI